jgi:hypothetical protein
MAEVKNSFLSSKMNKDLDDRLIPNNEYQDAWNIQVNTAEGNNIGVLQSVLGNQNVVNYNDITGSTNLQCIGSYADKASDNIYLFLTSNTRSTYQPKIYGTGVVPLSLYNPYLTESVTSASLIGNIATITWGIGVGSIVNVGDVITISGVTNNVFNGTYTIIAVPSYNTFSYEKVSANVTSGVGGTATIVAKRQWRLDSLPNTDLIEAIVTGPGITEVITVTNTTDINGSNPSVTFNKSLSLAVGATLTFNSPFSNNFIYSYNTINNSSVMLVQGAFLNFSTLNLILGVNLIEGLLFFTDNRNQPRRINVDKANPNKDPIPTYYTTEDQISVSKLSPVLPIDLFRQTDLTTSLLIGQGSLSSVFQQAAMPNPSYTGIVTLVYTPAPNLSYVRVGSNITATPSPLPLGGTLGIGRTTITGLVDPAGQQSTVVIYPTVFSVSSATWSSNIATLTTTTPHDIPVGRIITVAIPYLYTSKTFSWYANTVTVTTSNEHYILQGQTVNIGTNGPLSGYEGTYTVTSVPSSNTFTYSLATPKGSITRELPITINGIIGYRGSFVVTAVTDTSISYERTVPQQPINVKGPSLYTLPYGGTLTDIKNTAAGLYETSMYDAVSPYLPNNTTINPYLDPSYNGNTQFLEDKFVRFSYRYRFEDGEYSIIAPFTQIAFIPKQDGYFIYDGSTSPTIDNEADTYRSTIVDFMENKVNKVILQIPLLAAAKDLAPTCKVSDIEILYKNSNTLSVDVVDVVSIDDGDAFWDTENKIYKYTYTGEKPFRTLPERELIRVSDKTPIKALTQEAVSNRIVYGNYQDKFYYPKALNFNAGFSNKSSFDPLIKYSDKNGNEYGSSIKEYPNHSIKQNRNYQVGVVLCDKFGRESGVIVSSSSNSGTFSIPYLSSSDVGSILEWPGLSIKVSFNSKIEPATKDTTINWPGLYNGDPTSIDYNPLGWYSYKIVIKQTQQEYYNIYLPGIMAAYPNNTSLEIGKTSHIALLNDNINKVPADLITVGPTQRQFRSDAVLFTRVQNNTTAAGNAQYYPSDTNSTVNTIADLNSMFFSSQESSITLNNTVYLVNGTNAGLTITVASVTGLAVGMTVTITAGNGAFADGTYVVSIDAGSNTFVVSATPTATLGGSTIRAVMLIPYIGYDSFYTYNSNPLIARISTKNQIGIPARTAGGSPLTLQKLAVMETLPVESKLDIYWETSTSGLISELNTAIDAGVPSGRIVLLDNWGFYLNENSNIDTDVIPNSGYFVFKDNTDTIIAPISVSINDARFTVYAVAGSSNTQWKVKTNSLFVFEPNNDYNLFTFTITATQTGYTFTKKITNNLLTNSEPSFTITPPIVSGIPTITAILNQTNLFTFYAQNGTNTANSDINKAIGLTYSVRNGVGDWNKFNMQTFTDSNGLRAGRLTSSSALYDNYYITIDVSDAGSLLDSVDIKIVYPPTPTSVNFYGNFTGSFAPFDWKTYSILNQATNSESINGYFQILGNSKWYIHSWVYLATSNVDHSEDVSFSIPTEDLNNAGVTAQSYGVGKRVVSSFKDGSYFVAQPGSPNTNFYLKFTTPQGGGNRAGIWCTEAEKGPWLITNLFPPATGSTRLQIVLSSPYPPDIASGDKYNISNLLMSNGKTNADLGIPADGNIVIQGWSTNNGLYNIYFLPSFTPIEPFGSVFTGTVTKGWV